MWVLDGVAMTLKRVFGRCGGVQLAWAAIAAVVLVAAGCGSDGLSAPQLDGGPVAVDSVLLDGVEGDVVEALVEGYSRVAEVWPGCAVPPSVLVLDRSQSQAVVLAVNHPDAEALGAAEAVDVVAPGVVSVHRVVMSDPPSSIADLRSFAFEVELGGTRVFAMPLPPSADLESLATFFHEQFHQHQIGSWVESSDAQDVNGYDYSPLNLELAVLEGRALEDALLATDGDARLAAVRRFVALREYRGSLDGRVSLDDAQERFEGSAQYVEFAAARAEDNSDAVLAEALAAELVTDFSAEGVRESFGFGRFYGTGSAALHLTRVLGVDDLEGRLAAGEDPASVLAGAPGVEGEDVDALVAEARSLYDPSGELAAAAAVASDRAAGEPPFTFGVNGVPESAVTACLAQRGLDSATASPEDRAACGAVDSTVDPGVTIEGGDPEFDTSNGGFVLTPEQMECLIDSGADLAGGVELSPELAELCDLPVG